MLHPQPTPSACTSVPPPHSQMSDGGWRPSLEANLAHRHGGHAYNRQEHPGALGGFPHAPAGHAPRFAFKSPRQLASQRRDPSVRLPAVPGASARPEKEPPVSVAEFVSNPRAGRRRLLSAWPEADLAQQVPRGPRQERRVRAAPRLALTPRHQPVDVLLLLRLLPRTLGSCWRPL